MSGRKSTKVRISRDSYDRMLRDTRRADDAVRAAEQRAEKERKQNRKIRQDFKSQQKTMQAEYRRGLKNLSADMRDLETRQAERIEDIQRQTEQDLLALEENVASRIEEQGEQFQEALVDLEENVTSRIEEQGERFQKALQRQGERFQQALTTHRTEVAEALQEIRDDIRTDRARQRDDAQSQLNDLETLFQLMRDQPAHERFAPGELHTLESRLASCRADLNSGNFQTALANARERYFEYQELQLRIAERQAEWEAYLAEVQRLTEKTSGAMAAAEGATYTFAKSEASQEVEAQVDYWSEGALTDFRDRLKGHLERLASPEEIDTDSLKQMLKEIAPMEDELASIVARAKERLVQSQVRQNLAASILTSFEGTPWELNESTYEGKDFRKGLHLKLKNAVNEAEEIVASITPVETEGGVTANVEINFFDDDNDKNFRNARLERMYGRMRKEGVNVGSFECLDRSEDGPGAVEMRDFERLRTGQTAHRAH